jgi:YegS/Rv2252/BmrU family lipid kinase
MSAPLLVANPLSGGGRAGRTLDEVRRVIERRLGPVDVALTGRSGHGIELAREAVSGGRQLIVALGGDGTLHEVANGVLDAGGRAAVGYVGLGTGGDFRRTLGIEHRLDAYVEALASGRERLVDAGKLRFRTESGETAGRWFVNIVSAGLGGLVDRYVATTSKVLGGTAAYYWASLRAIAVSHRGRLRCDVSLAGRREERRASAYMIAVCNGGYFGSGMHVAPMAKLDDGRFEVIAMDASGRLPLLGFSRRIYTGQHLESPDVQHFACDRIAMNLENESARDVFLLDVDGEPLGGLPLEVELVPKALRLRA